MGTSPSSQTLQPLQTITDPHFGQVQLYKTSQIAHLMKKTFTFIQRSPYYRTLLSNLKFMQDFRHSSLVPVHKLIHKQCTQQQNSEKHLCIEYEVIEAYIEYYNFTLKSIIEAGRRLSKEQLWYVLLGLADLAVLLKENGIRFRFDVDNIFITLSGIPCVYLIDGVGEFMEQNEEEDERLGSENTLSVSLANTILNLVEYDEIEQVQYYTLEKMDINLFQLVKRMKMGEIELEEIPQFIQSLLSDRRVSVSKALSVTTKFMNQLKKQTTQNQAASKQKEKEKEKQREKEKQLQREREQQISQKEKQKIKLSLTLPSSNTVSLQFPPKFLIMQQSLDQKKRNNSQKQQMMKKRMEEILSKQSQKVQTITIKQSGIKQKENANSTMKVGKGINSLSISTVTSRQSLNNSQQIKPMRSSVLWRRKALELIKKEH